MPSEKRERQRQGRIARQEELRVAQQKAKRKRQAIIAAVIVLLFGGVYYLVVVRNGGKKVATSTTTTTTQPGTATTTTTVAAHPPVSVPVISAPANLGCPAADGSSPHYTKFAAAPPACTTAGKTYTATMQTDAGTIVLKLDTTAAPKTANNFVFLAGYHFFDGTAFHRVVTNFVDQGGDPTGTGTSGPGYQFADELPKAGAYKAGSLAMANSGPNTNGSQFFIVASDTGGAGLQPNFSLFGQVTSGMDVALKINADGTDSGAPKVVHKIVKVTIAVT